ncbi:MAG: DNA alkylation repair protein [Muribaculaceae bacterium]|nr:DNA alkylation repair protein [Muribaculaceae bacterium]
MTASEVIAVMEQQRDEKQRQALMRFFRTGPGQYGEGDEFLGLKVPQTRHVARLASDLPCDEITSLLTNRWHEVRLCGLLLLVDRFERSAKLRLADDPAATSRRDLVVQTYLDHARWANNWDLVDLSAPKILGHWLLLPTAMGGTGLAMHHDYKLQVLDSLADSDNLWLQRMSIVCTWKTTQQGEPSYCLRYAERHLHHPHDLMHKAVGWMLREMGKRISMDLLRQFLEQHAHEMPRTALRYAIERMSVDERQYWMGIK